MAKQRVLTACALLLWSRQVFAQEPSGCDKFKWPIEREQALLNASPLPRLPTSGNLILGQATILVLAPKGEARLSKVPERLSKTDPAFEGYFSLPAPAQRGLYQITLSAAAWLDVIQNDAFAKPAGFSGALDCVAVRKVVRYELEPTAATLQFSGAASQNIAVLISLVK